MRTSILLSLLGSVLLAGSSAFAGGAVSSGGGSFRDQHNPWFLRNVSQVHYCLKVDAATFSASADTARADIQQAIAYWQSQFSTVHTLGADGAVQIATQSFLEVDCSANPDITFILGYGGLSDDQINFFKDKNDPTVDVTGYIGVTVRETYDPVNMRGAGYVYISSDMGPHVFVNDGNLITPAWTKPNLLLYALIHEMGHVFGFPHTGSGIMSEVFLEQMLDQHLTYLFQQAAVESFLIPGPTITDCFVSLKPGALAWFGAPAGTTALQVQLNNITEIPVYAVVSQGKCPDPSAKTVKIGSFTGISISGFSDMRSTPGIFVHLVPQQTLFTQQEAGFRGFIVGPSFIDLGAQANYVPLNGAVKPSYVRLTSTSLTALGVQPTGKFGIMYSYESPIDILVASPPNPSTALQDLR